MPKQRYEREIEELLARMEGHVGRRPRARGWRRFWQQVKGHGFGGFRGLFSDITPGRIMLLSLGLLFLALFLNAAQVPAARPIALVGGLAFVISYILHFIRGEPSPREKRWRGRAVSFPREQDPLPQWLARWRDWWRRNKR